jgi:hypothetical protein
MRTLLILPLALLAACATSPTHLVEQGMRQEFTSAMDSKSAAECTAKRARFSVDYDAWPKEQIRPDNYRVVVAKTYWTYDPIIVIDTSPAGTGSSLRVYTSRWLEPVTVSDWMARLRTGC